MTFQQTRDLFLAVTGIAVVLASFYVAASWHAYETDRDNHRTSQEVNK